jgi:cytosine/adenosine deaminase-related metal-dependent hydrolase
MTDHDLAAEALEEATRTLMVEQLTNGLTQILVAPTSAEATKRAEYTASQVARAVKARDTIVEQLVHALPG